MGSTTEIIMFVFSILVFIFSISTLYSYNGLTKKKAEYASSDDEYAACGVSFGNISSGLGFSAVMLCISFVLMIYYGWMFLPSSQKQQLQSYMN
ncbi:MAG: hypothetical protein JKX76_01190 [Colwellia sp.]|nr:hypothetical protein [Colwellia sp.]